MGIANPLRRDLHLSIIFVEALGNAAIAISELELSFDVLVAILADEPERYGHCEPRDPFERKIEYLAQVSHSRLLKHQWWRMLRQTAQRAKAIQRQYKSAAMGSVYSRGAGVLEQQLRQLAQMTDVSPRLLPITPAKLNDVGKEATQLALTACKLAGLLLAAADKLSIDLAGVQRSPKPGPSSD